MSELKNLRVGTNDLRWRLLTTVSALALLGALHGAKATDDTDHPVLWIELGGQLERNTGEGDVFEAPFLQMTPLPGAYKPESPLHAEKQPLYSKGAEGKITFQPENSDWVFSASVRYGRSNSSKHVHQQTFFHLHEHFGSYSQYITPSRAKFADTEAKSNESHSILDFQAGKDIGLGMFGAHSTSTVSVGVRFAQFTSKTSTSISAAPNFHFVNFFPTTSPYSFPIPHEYIYKLSGEAERSFHAFGPSVSWNAAAAIAGRSETREITIDWGVNAAVLFGRQKSHIQHHTTGEYFCNFCGGGPHGSGISTLYKNTPPSRASARSVVVPNVGGFAGVSFRYADAKISFGYRGDFFFGAIDGGIDTRKEQTLGFFGPFATISLGIGG